MRAIDLLVNHQMITVHLEHERLIGHALRSGFHLDIVEYCLMDFLDGFDGELDNSHLRDFKARKYKTLLAAVTSLEDKGLVRKRAIEGRKAFAMRLTDAGDALVREINDAVLELMRATFWRNIPDDEIADMMATSVGSLDNLKAAPMDLYREDGRTSLIHPYFFLDLVFTNQRWRDIVQREASLSLNAYRILDLLESFGRMAPSEIASTLCIERSGVSLNKRSLAERELVRQQEGGSDRRRQYLQCTEKGRLTARRTRARLEEETRGFFSPVDADLVNVLNAQHLRMYCEVRRLHDEGAANA